MIRIQISRQLALIIASLVAITFYKFWLADVYSLRAIYAPQDDYLFINLARNILDGNWLGEYNQYTLMKGLFYPLWIAFINLFEIPLLTAQQLLYALSCTIFLLAINPHVKNKWWLILIYAFLIFNPFSIGVDRVLRLGIYPSLTILVFTCAYGLYSRSISARSSSIWWAVGLGISLAAFWHTREERIWIMPSLAMLLGVGLLHAIYKYKTKAVGFVLISMTPVVIVYSSTLSLSYINWKHYRIFTPLEIGTEEFKSAYSGLLRIRTETFIRHYPVTHETINKASNVSPAFREIKPALLAKSGEYPSLNFGMRASHFIWTLRDSVQASGYYNFEHAIDPKDIPETLDLYKRIGHEIHTACDSGKLDCATLLNPFFPQWRMEDNAQILTTLNQTVTRLVTWGGFDYKVNDMRSEPFYPETNMLETLLLFRSVTNESLRPHRRNAANYLPAFEQDRIHVKRKTARNIWRNFYQRLSPVFFIVFSILIIFRFIYEVIRRRLQTMTTFSVALLGGILSHSLIMTLIQINAFTEVLRRSQFTVYPVLIMFIVTGFIVSNEAIRLYRTNNKDKD